MVEPPLNTTRSKMYLILCYLKKSNFLFFRLLKKNHSEHFHKTKTKQWYISIRLFNFIFYLFPFYFCFNKRIQKLIDFNNWSTLSDVYERLLPSTETREQSNSYLKDFFSEKYIWIYVWVALDLKNRFSAFVGFPSDDSAGVLRNHVLSAFLIGWNTFAFRLFFGLLLPLLMVIKLFDKVSNILFWSIFLAKTNPEHWM